MSKKINLIRICLTACCFLNIAEAQCNVNRCVSVRVPTTNSSVEIISECGQECATAIEVCPQLEDCVLNEDTAACEACASSTLDQIMEDGESLASECGGGSYDDDTGDFLGAICLQTVPASALEVNLCCSNNDIIDEILDCFSATATADVEKKGKTLVKDIQVGDKVLTVENEYKTVYTVDHKDPSKKATFVQIHSTANAESPLEITERHMVFLHGEEKPIPASAVKVGDALQTVNSDSPSFVTKISFVERLGVWNPITVDGTVVVDGIVTSTYSMGFRANDEANVELAGSKVMSHHDFYHLLMTPYRAMCLGLSLSLCETNSKFNGYSQFGIYLSHIFEKQGAVVQDFIIFVGLQTLFAFKLFSLAMNPLAVTGVVLGAGTYFYKKTN